MWELSTIDLREIENVSKKRKKEKAMLGGTAISQKEEAAKKWGFLIVPQVFEEAGDHHEH